MQIFHWLFKSTLEQARENTSSSSPPPAIDDRIRDKGKGIVVSKQGNAGGRSGRSKFRFKGFSPLAFLCRKDVATACFYSTIHLRRVDSINRRRRDNRVNSVKMKKEEIVAASNNGGNKVLPISDNTLPSSRQDKPKGDKTRNISRMKELLRWAAAAKSGKSGKFLGRKVLYFRNKATLKAVPDDDQLSNESPKISLRWDVESCSTTSSVYSAISMASSAKNDRTLNMLSANSTPAYDRKGNWITTDSEFVVLEL